MRLERVFVYAAGALLILFGLWRRPTRLRARSIAGNVVVGDGPFVMNNEAEIRQAIADFNAGRFGRMAGM